MPVPAEVIVWLDEEENTAAQDGILIYRIWERLRQQNMDEANIAEDACEALLRLNFLHTGRSLRFGGQSFLRAAKRTWQTESLSIPTSPN